MSQPPTALRAGPPEGERSGPGDPDPDPRPRGGIRCGRILHLAADPVRVRAQLAGQDLTRDAAGPLRDDISTDEMAPLAAMVHFDAALGRHAHTGFTAGGQRPIGLGALQAAGISVLVGGRRYGKGSSREHAPLAELSAGVRLVVAASFERLYRDNADNLGLLTSTDLTLPDRLQQGGTVTLDELLADRPPQAAAIVRAGGLLRWQPNDAPDDAPEASADAAGPLTLFEKIVARHHCSAGLVRPDWRFIHEYYTGMAAHLLEQAFGEGLRLHEPQTIVCFEDHLTLAQRSPLHVSQGLLPGARRLGQVHRDFAARHGLTEHGVHADGEGSEGISHALMAERYARPGQLLVGTDSHTPHSGALGCVAFGVGTTEMARAFVTGRVRLGTPGVLRVQVEGRLPPGVAAKDLALQLLADPLVRSGGGIGRVFEFGGPAVGAMSTDERATLTNMTAEMGGFAGYVEPDAETVRFIAERRGEALTLAPWMCSDPGARYAAVLTVDAATLSPWVARPGDPGRGLPLAALSERPTIHIAYGGSCTAGKRADFEAYHAVLAWAAAQGLRVADGVQLYLQFGTDEVRAHAQVAGWCAAFEAVGATLLPPGCGACANGGPGASTRPGQVTVSAINRNFPGRSGPGEVWLASPATVAASAIAGRLMAFDELLAAHGAAVR